MELRDQRINALFERAEKGEKISRNDWVSVFQGYSKIILWGSSFLGKSIGLNLQEIGVKVDHYWDARYEEIEMVNQIKVEAPFTHEPEPDMLVILRIGNTAIRGQLLKRLSEHGYCNVMRGDRLFMGLVCRCNVDVGINGLDCNGSMNCRSMFCQRLHSIVKAQNDKGGIFLDNLTFMITTKCSLKCKYCVAYMNSYPDDRKRHISLEQIEKDIDSIFDNVDAVGAITIQGGEPFLHPDIDKIVAKILEKKNLGIVSIATNGIFKISEDKLGVFKDNRLNVAFSGYYDALSPAQLDVYYQNVEMMKRNGVPHTVGVKVPEWIIPPSLWDKAPTEEWLLKRKANCVFPERCMQVMDGKLYPCLYSISLHGVGVADYPMDYVNLVGDRLPDRIRQFIDAPYYMSCRHCDKSQGTTNMAGEQGFYDFVTPNN